jgi:hypothetical protein
LSVGGATEARFIAREPVGKKPGATGNEKLADGIRHPRAVAPCMPREVAASVPEWGA